MMNCDWTEKISLLVDGELARDEAARVENHLAACPACRAAHADFLGLRQEIRAFEHAPDITSQQRALKNILASGGAHAVVPSVIEGRETAPATGASARIREWLGDAFAAPRFRPALTAAALILLAVAAGLLLFVNSQDDSTGHETASLNGNHTVVQPTPATPTPATPEVATRSATPEVVKPQRSEIVTGQEHGISVARGVGDRKRDGRKINVAVANNSGARRRKANAARGGEPERFDVATTGELPETITAASDSAVSDSAFAVPRRSVSPVVVTPAPEVEAAARHVERAQVLLRSFRNARFNRSDPTYDVASEKMRSRKLLYQNILLRRDAATRGDLPVENLLSRLEPVLLDIANLPDKPRSADVRPIRDRIERRKMVGLLQVHTPLASRSAY